MYHLALNEEEKKDYSLQHYKLIVLIYKSTQTVELRRFPYHNEQIFQKIKKNLINKCKCCDCYSRCLLLHFTSPCKAVRKSTRESFVKKKIVLVILSEIKNCMNYYIEK